MRQVSIGFHCSHEQHPPSRLLRHAKLAAQAGFAHAMCSDHFAPWSHRQGHAGFTWSWLGSALEGTPLSFGTVCAPGQRYHPAVIAQGAATLAEMYPDRFWLAVGSGEALNEAITGAPWPAKPDRNARLKECVDVMRALWAGEEVTLRSHVVVSRARLFVRPARPPLIVGAALSPETARWMGAWADALVTVAGPRENMRQVVDAFREGGGERKPMFLQVALSCAPTDEESAAAARDQWTQAALGSSELADIETPADFDRATASATVEQVAGKVRISCDIERHLEWLRADAELGFERLYLHNVARAHQERFIDLCATRLLPAARGFGSAEQAEPAKFKL
ncbi:MAG TPA: TIGR03885 family FMN-dependent LLM class oxidoreductase [Vicinamibacterales bacterium]|nr:TIGR03885 family FMN-dependent LLM class oxidoreductase [Vicinamibacterales bacterium]